MTERESLLPPEEYPVGQGPLYEVMRAEARKLIPLFAPGGVANCDRYWGAGICGIVNEQDGSHRVSVDTYGREKRALGVNWKESIDTLRASAVSILVYCEAHDV